MNSPRGEMFESPLELQPLQGEPEYPVTIRRERHGYIVFESIKFDDQEMPYDYLRGQLSSAPEGTVGIIHRFRVENLPGRRQQGRGTHLAGAFVSEAVALGAVAIQASSVMHPATVKIFRRIFGADVASYHQKFYQPERFEQWDMDDAQAIEHLERRQNDYSLPAPYMRVYLDEHVQAHMFGDDWPGLAKENEQ